MTSTYKLHMQVWAEMMSSLRCFLLAKVSYLIIITTIIIDQQINNYQLLNYSFIKNIHKHINE